MKRNLCKKVAGKKKEKSIRYRRKKSFIDLSKRFSFNLFQRSNDISSDTQS